MSFYVAAGNKSNIISLYCRYPKRNAFSPVSNHDSIIFKKIMWNSNLKKALIIEIMSKKHICLIGYLYSYWHKFWLFVLFFKAIDLTLKNEIFEVMKNYTE